MSDLKKICHELDDIVTEYFKTVDEIYRLQTELDTNMKDGLLLMAKARYSMGHKAVSMLQYNEDDLDEAGAHVEVEDSELHKRFEIVKSGPTLEAKKNNEPSDPSCIRKRNKGQKEGESSDKSASALIVENDSKPNKKGDFKDVLKWFGVLVPPALRQSQTRFKTCIELSCDLATKQSKLLTLKERFKKMIHEKNIMLNNDGQAFAAEDIDDNLISLRGSSLSSAEDLTEDVEKSDKK